MSEKLWEAKKEDIKEPELEVARRCLYNSYNSYVQTHAGYMIALTIGFLTLVSNFSSFFKKVPVLTTFSFSTVVSLISSLAFWFIILILLTILGSLFMVLRIIYWSCFASCALNFTVNEVIQRFNKANSDSRNCFEKPPTIAILHTAIGQRINKDENPPLRMRLARKVKL